MSGHSHYATIKRQKGTLDQARGKLFSKLSKAISIAIKAGGGADPNSNYKLRVAIDAAKTANMPKANIERILAREEGAEALEEVSYEGYCPEGMAVIVETATDNRNRTGQEIKGIFEHSGGSLAGPGAVSFNFEPSGVILVKKEKNKDEQMLKIIDIGAKELEETEDGIEVYVAPELLGQFRDKLENVGFAIISFELTQQPKNYLTIEDGTKASKALTFLDTISEHDDVQKVFANINIPQDVLAKIS